MSKRKRRKLGLSLDLSSIKQKTTEQEYQCFGTNEEEQIFQNLLK